MDLQTRTDIRLTSFSHGAGCACKLGPAQLDEVLGLLAPAADDPALLVGYQTGDDAAVYQIDERTALVFTADFFTPIVDDAADWGRIAAANALSDVYAMGGRPILCLNLTGWPHEQLPAAMLARVLEGGAEVARRAGAIVAGGHTIDDREPTYGMAVVGLADPDRIVTNARVRAGDVLVLTKPLGLGVISTAIKRGSPEPGTVEAAVRTMTTLNAAASEAMLLAGVRAGTDVTGFGLLGHLHRMLVASGVSATLSARAVPLLPGARALASAGFVPGGTVRNRAFIDPWCSFDAGIEEVDRILLADAQTSGGLLLSCPPGRLEQLHGELRARGVAGAEIGRVQPGDPGRVVIGE